MNYEDERALATEQRRREPVQGAAQETQGETRAQDEAEESQAVTSQFEEQGAEAQTSDGREEEQLEVALGRPRVPLPAASQTAAPPPGPLRSMRRVFLLLGLLFTIGLVALSVQRPEEPQLHFAQRGLPEVVAPSGTLLSVFEQTRPASLQLEVRSGNVFNSVVQGVGSGFFISPDGLVLTAYHVVDPTNPGQARERSIVAVGPNQMRYPLELIGFDAYLDLALLQADVSNEVPYLPLTGLTTEIGSEVLAIGNSRGDFLEGRVGEVTRLDVAPLRSTFADTAIELTAPLAPGDSGGPVINADGEAIGVVSYIALSGAPQGIIAPFAEEGGRFNSYAVPVSAESDVIASLRAGERRDIPVIGFTLGSRRYGLTGAYNPRRERRFDLGPRAGVIVGNVAPNSPAERAGLRDLEAEPITNDAGQVVDFDLRADVITAVDGQRTRNFDELLGVLREKGVGTEVTITVQRGGETVDLALELASKSVTFGAQ